MDNDPKVDEDSKPVEAAEPSVAPDPEMDKQVDVTLDETSAPVPSKKPASSRKEKLQALWQRYLENKKRNIPLTIVALLLLILLVPFTRYPFLGIVLKKPVSITVLDSKTNVPVSSAHVSIGGQVLTTNGSGVATGKIKVGHKQLHVTKQYYKDSSSSELVGLSSSHNRYKVELEATGRQVPVTVVNKISGKPVSGVKVAVLDTQALTNKKGVATIVLPTSQATRRAKLSLNGYNTGSVTLQVTDKKVPANTVGITPAGHLYFLSNLSGNIDVVKTNLDGSGRQTVLKGTGNEDFDGTGLLASRDWKYLALISKRDGGKYAKIFLIDTTNNDKLTTIDEGNADFSLVGWSDHRFVYTATRSDVQDWQPNQQALKSYDAPTGKLTTLDQTAGSGSSASDWTKEIFGSVYILKNQLAYVKNWASYYGNPTALADKQATFNVVNADGSGKKAVRSFGLADGTQASGIYLTTNVYEPNGIYISYSNGNKENFYEYENGQVSDKPDLNTQKFYSTSYVTYLLSPSGNHTFWTTIQDGKNSLFVGDADGNSKKQVASLSSYSPYAWYTDNYVLVSKDKDELYIMPADGSKAPIKVTDYYKSPLNFIGYGGGYGGL